VVRKGGNQGWWSGGGDQRSRRRKGGGDKRGQGAARNIETRKGLPSLKTSREDSTKGLDFSILTGEVQNFRVGEGGKGGKLGISGTK